MVTRTVRWSASKLYTKVNLRWHLVDRYGTTIFGLSILSRFLLESTTAVSFLPSPILIILLRVKISIYLFMQNLHKIKESYFTTTRFFNCCTKYIHYLKMWNIWRSPDWTVSLSEHCPAALFSSDPSGPTATVQGPRGPSPGVSYKYRNSFLFQPKNIGHTDSTSPPGVHHSPANSHGGLHHMKSVKIIAFSSYMCIGCVSLCACVWVFDTH